MNPRPPALEKRAIAVSWVQPSCPRPHGDPRPSLLLLLTSAPTTKLTQWILPPLRLLVWHGLPPSPPFCYPNSGLHRPPRDSCSLGDWRNFRDSPNSYINSLQWAESSVTGTASPMYILSSLGRRRITIPPSSRSWIALEWNLNPSSVTLSEEMDWLLRQPARDLITEDYKSTKGKRISCRWHHAFCFRFLLDGYIVEYINYDLLLLIIRCVLVFRTSAHSNFRPFKRRNFKFFELPSMRTFVHLDDESSNFSNFRLIPRTLITCSWMSISLFCNEPLWCDLVKAGQLSI